MEEENLRRKGMIRLKKKKKRFCFSPFIKKKRKKKGGEQHLNRFNLSTRDLFPLRGQEEKGNTESRGKITRNKERRLASKGIQVATSPARKKR